MRIFFVRAARKTPAHDSLRHLPGGEPAYSSIDHSRRKNGWLTPSRLDS